MYLAIEISELIEIILNFFIEFHDEDNDVFVRDLKLIAFHYFQQGFVYDFLAILPVYTIVMAVSNVKDTVPKIGYNWLYIVFILKTFRSYKAYSITTPKYISDEIKEIFTNLRQRSIDKEREAI